MAIFCLASAGARESIVDHLHEPAEGSISAACLRIVLERHGISPKHHLEIGRMTEAKST